jgi:hypothetical protein
VRAAVYKNLVDAGVGQELKRVLDERGVGEGQQALRAACQRHGGQWHGRTHSRALEREGIEACLERVGEYLGNQHCLGLRIAALTTACSGSSRSSSPELPFSWPFFPFGGMLSGCVV